MSRLCLALAGGAVVWAGAASAGNIFVMGPNRGEVFNVVNTLEGGGHSVTFNNETPLADYAGFDQVWDLRFGTALDATDRAAFTAHLQAGGVLYLSGENATFDARNNSINTLTGELGLGLSSFRANAENATQQPLTAEGAALFGGLDGVLQLNLFFARVVEPPSSGTLMSETAPGSGVGSLVGWQQGDIASAPGGVLFTGYDIELLGGGNPGMIEAIGGVPEPTGAAVLLLGGLALIRRRAA